MIGKAVSPFNLDIFNNAQVALGEGKEEVKVADGEGSTSINARFPSSQD